MPNSSASPSSGSIRRSSLRYLRRVGTWLILIILIGYGASNLWLSSRWGTGMAEAKLKARTGLDWEVGSMTWSPWGGLTVHDVRMLQPEELKNDLTDPVISVESIQVEPYWDQLLRGKLSAREVTLNAPKATVDLKMLAAMASNISPAKKPLPKIKPPRLSKPPKGKNPAPKPPRKPPLKKPSKPAPKKSPKPRPKVEPDLPPPGLPLWLHIKGGSLRVVSVEKDIELLRVEGADFETQIFGEDTEGQLKLEALKVLGLPQVKDLKQTVVWSRPYLEIKKQTLHAGGLELKFMAQLGANRDAPGKHPFLIDFSFESQKLDSEDWLERLALELEAEKLAGKFRLVGELSNPMSWRGDFLMVGENVKVLEKHGDHDVVFDEVFMPVLFRQGQLRWSGVRLIGEDVSILGNGQVSVRDGVLSVTRLVVSPEVSDMLLRALYAVQGTPGYLGRWWKNLDTPDRKMRDLLVSGDLANPMVDVGRGNADLPVWNFVSLVLDFIRSEMKEEGKALPDVELLEGVNHENH